MRQSNNQSTQAKHLPPPNVSQYNPQGFGGSTGSNDASRLEEQIRSGSKKHATIS